LCHRQPLLATRGFEANAYDARERAQPLHQRLHAGFVIAHGKALAPRMHMHIQPCLAHIDTYGDLHLVPSLPKRARSAAPATVRDRWIDAGRPMLSSGLRCPRGTRATPHHRGTILTRCCRLQVTRGDAPPTEPRFAFPSLGFARAVWQTPNRANPFSPARGGERPGDFVAWPRRAVGRAIFHMR